MSGGSLEYLYSKIDMAIRTEESIDEDEYISEQTKPLVKKCFEKLQEASKIAYELEWYLSADTGDETFPARLKKQLGYDLMKDI